jgi:hypothetical protein
MEGRPDPTSYVERQNLIMQMQMRRFKRLTNAFSEKRRKPLSHGLPLHRLVQLRQDAQDATLHAGHSCWSVADPLDDERYREADRRP